MRILVFLLFSFTASAQIPLYQLEYATDSMKVIGAAADGEPIWVNRSSAAKVENSPTMTLRIQNDSIRADIKKRLNAINVGGADVFLSLQIDSTGQIYGVNEIISDDFDKDQFNELQGISIDSLNRVFRITLTDGGVVKFLDRGILSEVDGSTTNELPQILYYFSGLPSISGTKIGDYAWDGGTNWHISDGSSWSLLSSGDFEIIRNSVSSNDSTYRWRYNHENNINGDFGIQAKESTGILIDNPSNQIARLSIDTSLISTITNVRNIISDSLATIPRDTVTLTDSGTVTVTGAYPNFNIHGVSDEIIRTGNTITLRDGDGSVDLSDLVNRPDSTTVVNSYGTIITESPSNTWNIKVDSSKFVTPYDLTLIPSGTVTNVTASSPLASSGGATPNITLDTTSATGAATQYDLTLKQNLLSGANKRIPYFTGTSTLSNSDNLSFDNSVRGLGIGTVSPQATLDLSSSGGNSIRFYDSAAGTNYKEWKIQIGNDGREMNFVSRSDLGSEYNFMTFNRATNSQIMANWYAPFISSTTGTGDNVMTINEVGSIYRSPLKTINSASLFGSGNIGVENPLTFSAPLSRSTNTVSIPAASTSVSGHLTSTDWNMFNNKLGSLNGLTTATQTFSTTNNALGFSVTSSGSNHAFNLPYTEDATGIRLGLNAKLSGNSVALGNNAGDTGCSNCFSLGKDVLSNVTTASNNLGIGLQALFSQQTGGNNIGIGNYANYFGTGTNNSIFIGESSGLNNLTGTDNVFIGRLAGRNNTGSYNVFIGSAAGFNEANSNRLYIATTTTSTPLIGGHFDNNRVGINTPIGSIASTLHVTGGTRITDLAGSGIRMVTANGNGDLGTAAILSGTGTANTLAFWDSGTSIASSQITRSSLGIGFGVASGSITHSIDMASGNTIRLRTGANIMDRLNSGGANGFVLQATGGNGVEWVSTSGLFSEVDGSVTNEGFLGVGSSGTNQSLLQGYNSSGTPTGTGVTFQSQQSVTMTETTSTNGGTINIGLSRPYAHLRLTGFNTSQTLSANTWTKINFENIQNSNAYTASTTTEDITIGSNNTGVAECTFTSFFIFPASPNTGFFEVALFKNGSQITQSTISYLLSEAGRYWSVPISWTENFANTTDTIDVRVRSSSAMTGLTVSGANFIVQRIN